MRITLLLRAAVATLMLAPIAGTAIADEPDPRGVPKPPSAASQATPRGREPDRRAKDPDQDLLDHLEQVEKLELLQNLDLFDTAAGDAARRAR